MLALLWMATVGSVLVLALAGLMAGLPPGSALALAVSVATLVVLFATRGR